MQKKLEIVDVIGREIVDSRGNPTVEAEELKSSWQTARSAEEPLPPAHPPVNSKPSNSATGTRPATAAKASPKRSRTSILSSKKLLSVSMPGTSMKSTPPC